MTPYQILGIPPHSSRTQIKAAYRRAAASHHPDRGGSHEAMVTINAAYEQLTRVTASTSHHSPRKPSPPTPTNLSDWFLLYNQLLSVVERRGYKRGWITYRLEELKPPLEVWQLHGQVMGYKSGFAHHRWKQQGDLN